jgi:hypothetical protein
VNATARGVGAVAFIVGALVLSAYLVRRSAPLVVAALLLMRAGKLSGSSTRPLGFRGAAV